MSTWHVNASWTDFFALDGGPLHWVDVGDGYKQPAIDDRDILSAPGVETLLPSGLALWPRGAAWGSPDGEAPRTDTVFAGLTRALLAPFADLYAKSWRLIEESRSGTLVDSLEDWERDFGLPSRCVTGAQTREQRLATLRARVAGLATITPADVIRLAAGLGYVVAVEEPDAFLAGDSALNGLGELSDAALEQQWVILVRDAPFSRFEAGISEAGADRLLDFDNGALECEIERIRPAWTLVYFNYAEHPVGPALATEGGDLLVTEFGALLIAPVFASDL